VPPLSSALLVRTGPIDWFPCILGRSVGLSWSEHTASTTDTPCTSSRLFIAKRLARRHERDRGANQRRFGLHFGTLHRRGSGGRWGLFALVGSVVGATRQGRGGCVRVGVTTYFCRLVHLHLTIHNSSQDGRSVRRGGRRGVCASSTKSWWMRGGGGGGWGGWVYFLGVVTNEIFKN
jgi:hypothetical protein